MFYKIVFKLFKVFVDVKFYNTILSLQYINFWNVLRINFCSRLINLLLNLHDLHFFIYENKFTKWVLKYTREYTIFFNIQKYTVIFDRI